MSDDEDYDMNADEGDEDYDFEYEEDEDDDNMGDDEGGEGDLENQYYIAKSSKEDDPEEAIVKLRALIDSQASEPGEWGFKSLKQSTKILFLDIKRPEEALKCYKELLPYTKSAVTKNATEKSINNILDYVAGEGKHGKKAPNVELGTLEDFYNATLKALEEAKNDRLSIKCNLKLARVYLERKEWGRLRALLKTLHEACSGSGTSSGTSAEDQTRAAMLLEIYATEIQMYSEQKEGKKMKAVYEATLRVKSSMPHPRIMGIIRECGGKMWMAERNWQKAYSDFYESFKQYDESGSPQRIQVLKYLVLACLLMGSDINPFDAQEAKPYRNDPQIMAMTRLVTAYENNEVHEAEKILRTNKNTILNDPFIRTYIDDLLQTLRTQYLVVLIKPYTRLELSFLAKQLNIETAEVEDLLIQLILDGKVKGKIDQQSGIVELERSHGASTDRYKALNTWSRELSSISRAIIDKSAPGVGNEQTELAMLGMGLA